MEIKPLAVDTHSCWNCKEEIQFVSTCPNCCKMLPISESENYFKFFGLKNQLNIDLEKLTDKFFGLSKECHPDFHANCSETEKDICMNRMAFINNAYKVLKDPISRAKYLLKLETEETTEDQKKVPGEILFEVMELQEKIELAASEKDTENIRILNDEISQMKNKFENKINSLNAELNNLFDKWDNLLNNEQNELRRTILDNINKNLMVRTYLVNIILTLNR